MQIIRKTKIDHIELSLNFRIQTKEIGKKIQQKKNILFKFQIKQRLCVHDEKLARLVNTAA